MDFNLEGVNHQNRDIEAVYTRVTDIKIENFFEYLKTDFERGRFSWVGEFNDFALGYLTFASILHAQTDGVALPVGQFVIGKTSSGKTELITALSKLIPGDRIVNLTSASPKSLIYQCAFNPHFFNGKVVFVEELSGLKDEELQYILRILVTKGYVKHTTVINSAMESIEIKGNISLQSTGLDCDTLRDDTMNRMMIARTDDSEEATRRVVQKIASRYSSEHQKNEDLFLEYKDFFSELKPYSVVIPFASEVKFDFSKVESRRGPKMFFDLLATVTLINQKRRKVENGQLIAAIEDYDFLMEISKKLEIKKEVKLSTPERVILAVIKEMQTPNFSYQQIVDAKPFNSSGQVYDISTVKKNIKLLMNKDIVKVESGLTHLN